MAHNDGKVMPTYIRAAEKKYEIQCKMELASMATSNEERKAFLDEACRLGECMRDVVFSLHGSDFSVTVERDVVFSLHKNGKIATETWTVEGRISRRDGPAYIQYGPDGELESEMWYVDGKEHRLDGPAIVTYAAAFDKTAVKNIICREIWYVDGKIHRDGDEPAMRHYFNDGTVHMEQWFSHGQKHRIGVPAFIIYYENGNVCEKTWYQHDKIHCEEQPAVIKYYNTGEIKETIWYLNGEMHRDGDEPARVCCFDREYVNTTISQQKKHANGPIVGMKWWVVHGKKHSSSGPAVITYYSDGNICEEVWYQHGVKINMKKGEY
ncbi:hypothetical protein A3B64_00495 [candidate division WWE3 bacterium RIFCSPLOWO2_01_FULL_37_24]|nr:MAG: hypothetical protein A3B64_00495 [candidate division WWE3 bacterium RIFCSPLOWO2_01_FULL_37_24]